MQLMIVLTEDYLFLLLEMAMSGNLGCKINSKSDIRKDSFLFGESQGRVVVTMSQMNN